MERRRSNVQAPDAQADPEARTFSCLNAQTLGRLSTCHEPLERSDAQLPGYLDAQPLGYLDAQSPGYLDAQSPKRPKNCGVEDFIYFVAMILSLVSQKGGVGKSTLAVSIAWELLARGRRVLMVDADPQGTARETVEIAKEAGQPAPSVVAMGKEMYRADQLPLIAQSFDDVIIDTPGKLGDIQRAALMVADLAIIPIGQSAADVWSLTATVELLDQAKAVHQSLVAAVVLTRRKPRTAIGKHAREPLLGSGLALLNGETTDRMAWQECIGAGKGVAQYAPKDTAAKELRAIVDEVLAMTHPRAEKKVVNE